MSACAITFVVVEDFVGKLRVTEQYGKMVFKFQKIQVKSCMYSVSCSLTRIVCAFL